MKTQTLEELLHEIYLCGVDENPFGEEDKTKEVLQLFKQAGEVAYKEGYEKGVTDGRQSVPTSITWDCESTYK